MEQRSKLVDEKGGVKKSKCIIVTKRKYAAASSKDYCWEKEGRALLKKESWGGFNGLFG